MPGYGFGYGYGAVGHARRTPLTAGGGTPTPTPTPTPGTALPALDAIVAHFDSAAIIPQADDSALAQWDDSSGTGAHAAQATSAKQPKYRTGGSGGRPYVEFDGTDDYLAIAAPGALGTAMDSRTYTVLAVVENAGGGDYACIFGASIGGGSPWLWAGATNIGWAAVNNGGSVVPHGAGTGYMALGMVSDTAYSAVAGASTLMRNVYRGAIYNWNISQAAATGSNAITIGASSTGAAFRFKGRIYRIIVWNRPLTPAELMQAEAYFNAAYSQTHPAVTLGRFLHLDGDSRTAGVGADGTQRLPYKLASSLGHPLGTYGVYAVGGALIAELIAKGGEVDAAAQALAGISPAIQHRLVYEEFFNSRLLAVGDKATAGTMAYQTAQYLSARRAGMPANLKIMGQSPMDHLAATSPQPTAWAAYIQANHAALGLDGLADVWASPLGGEDACPNAAPFAPWADGIHLTAAGQATQAAVIADACAALAGW